MAQWDISVPAGTNVTDTGNSTSDVSGSRPSDFDGATINSVVLVNAPTLTSNESSNDSIWVRWNIETSGGASTYGGVGADADSLCFINDTFSNINSGLTTVALGSATTPAPTTATATDWHQVAWDWAYTASGKDDDSDCSWAAFTIRVDYTPTGPIEGDTTFTINTSQTEASTKTISDSITYINQLSQNQDQMISINEALSFILQIAQQETGDKVIPLSVDLKTTMDFILQNVLTGEKSITIGTLLDQFSQNNIQTYQNALFNINLSDNYVGSAAAVIAGEVTFGSTIAYQASTIRGLSALANINVVLDKASQVSQLFEEVANFTFTLNLDANYLEAAVFDDPVYSAGNYIFVDLTNIALVSGAIQSAEITFVTQQGQVQSAGLIGSAAHTLLVQLVQNQVATKTTEADNTFIANLSKTSLASVLKLAEFSTTLNLDKISDVQLDALKTAVYLANLSQNQSTLTVSDKTLDLKTILDFNALKQLVGDVNINLGITLDYLINIKSDLSDAVTFLSSLDFINEGDTGIDAISNFNINTLITDQVQSLLNSTLILISNMSEAASKQAVTDKAIEYLIQLSQNQVGDLGIFGATSFILQMQEVDTVNLSAEKATTIITSLAEQYNVTLTTAETLTLVIQLADSYSTTKIIPTELTLSTSMQQIQSTLVDKLIAISFALTLDQIDTTKVDYNVFSTLISAFTTSFLGESTGKIDGFVTFISQISQNNTSISSYNKNITFADILSEEAIPAVDYFKNLNIILQVDQNQNYNLGQSGAVIFNTFYSKLDTAKIDYVPSIDFNLEALDIPKVSHDMLVNTLLGIEKNMLTEGNIGFTALANFGIQQDYDTELRLIAEGDLQLTTQLSQSTTLQHLGQVGITFGHLLGLSALSRAEFAENITFGTISDFQVNGFVLEFTITLPEGRTLKIYFEDRLTIIYPEDRIIKVT